VLLLGAGVSGLAGADSAPPAATAVSAPVVREARYRISAAVRPLLPFWVRTDNVGGARILWRGDGEGRRGYELLIGSDPRRAPRRINHWGWEREDAGPEGALLQGLKTEEDSLEDARAASARDGKDTYLYKSIRSLAAGGEVRAEASVKVDIEGELIHTAAEGNGPVNAVDGALRKALGPSFPELDAMHLVDYKVRILDGESATGARTRVLIESSGPMGTWATVGSHTNIIAASVAVDARAGPLRLQGSGTLRGGRVSFKGRASADPEMRQALIGLIGVLGRRVGDEAILALET